VRVSLASTLPLVWHRPFHITHLPRLEWPGNRPEKTSQSQGIPLRKGEGILISCQTSNSGFAPISLGKPDRFFVLDDTTKQLSDLPWSIYISNLFSFLLCDLPLVFIQYWPIGGQSASNSPLTIGNAYRGRPIRESRFPNHKTSLAMMLHRFQIPNWQFQFGDSD